MCHVNYFMRIKGILIPLLNFNGIQPRFRKLRWLLVEASELETMQCVAGHTALILCSFGQMLEYP